MPKPAKDLRLQGVQFTDALKRILSTPAPQKASRKAAKKALKKAKLN